MPGHNIPLGKIIFIVVACGSLFLLGLGFWPTILSLHDRWVAVNESYSHGYLIVFLAGYLFHRKYQKIHLTPSPSILALSLLFAISVVWFVGFITQTQLLEQLALPVVAWLVLAAVIGFPGALQFAAAFLLLYLALPLWDFLILPLRELTVLVVQQGLLLLEIPALIDGFNIHLTSGILVVAGGCSGLNYLLVGMVIGCLHAYTSFRAWKNRLLALILAIVVSLLGNWLRVFLLVLIGHYSQMESPLVYDHGTFGWVIFACFMAAYFLGLHYLIEPESAEGSIESVSRGVAPWPFSKMSVYLITATIITLLLPGWARWKLSGEISEGEVIYQNIDSTAFSPVAGSEGFWRAEYHGYDVVIERLAEVGSRQYQLVILGYLEQFQGKELIYYKNQLAGEGFVKNYPPLELGVGLSFNQSIVITPQGKVMVWWLYSVNGVLAQTEVMAKMLEMRSVLVDHPAAALITLSTPCTVFDCESELGRMGDDKQLYTLLTELVSSLKNEN